MNEAAGQVAQQGEQQGEHGRKSSLLLSLPKTLDIIEKRQSLDHITDSARNLNRYARGWMDTWMDALLSVYMDGCVVDCSWKDR